MFSSLYVVTAAGTCQGVYYPLGRIVDPRTVSLAALRAAGIDLRTLA